MSANDNEWEYLHVPRGPVDEAITAIESAINRTLLPAGAEYIFGLVVEALREIERNKRERYL
jgi:hypothetical protein